MSETFNCGSACPIQEWCVEKQIQKDLISSDVYIDASSDVITALRQSGAEVRQYSDEVFEDMSGMTRQMHKEGIDRSSPEYFIRLSEVMGKHAIPNDEWTSVMIGKVAWTAAKAVEEAKSEVAQIDATLGEFDIPAIQDACPGTPEIIEIDGSEERMCASSLITLARRQEITRP